MTKTWQLQDAKNRFSEVVERALHEGPQTVKRRGKETVVVLSIKDYQKLKKPKTSLREFFKRSPLYGLELDLTRKREYGREIDI